MPRICSRHSRRVTGRTPPSLCLRVRNLSISSLRISNTFWAWVSVRPSFSFKYSLRRLARSARRSLRPSLTLFALLSFHLVQNAAHAQLENRVLRVNEAAPAAPRTSPSSLRSVLAYSARALAAALLRRRAATLPSRSLTRFCRSEGAVRDLAASPSLLSSAATGRFRLVCLRAWSRPKQPRPRPLLRRG